MSSKTACPENNTNLPQAYDNNKPPWISLDPETDRGEHGLTPLLLHRLGHRVGGKQETFAQVLAQKLIDLALGGHFASLEEILIRIDGDTKNGEPATTTVNTTVPIDDLTAHRLLDTYHGKREGPQDD